MNGWTELKAAFWASVDAGPEERERQLATLAAIDPALPSQLEAMLAADARGEIVLPILNAEPSALAPPSRIGEYDVIEILGAGGMGEVYRAHDARLHRDVAIKVVRGVAGTHADRLARFAREARVLASLNHPHIAQVYGLTTFEATPALVMELVEGPTLAQLIAGAPGQRLPLARALRLARQIADGLNAAHERGVIHRDLKPGNIALTEAGDAKILDFGIAKSLEADASSGTPDQTVPGTMLGTPAYMSPEQARGEPCDRRTDIWAFGCVLFELLTGRGPFAGRTPSDSLAAVLEHAPDLPALPADVPAAVRSLVRHCLEKEPSRRLRDIADARLVIDDALMPSPEATGRPTDTGRTSGPAPAASSSRPAAITAGLGVAAVAMTLTTGLLVKGTPVTDSPRVVSSVVLPRHLRLAGADLVAQAAESRFAISPDGGALAIVAADGSGQVQLWIRMLASAAFQPLAGTEGASFPFWSPDSAAIGFVVGGRLRTIGARGGTVQTVSDAGFRRASWSRDGLILFTPAGRSPLYVVPAAGGEPRQVTTLDTAAGEVQHADPLFLPDGRRFLYFSFGTVAGGALDPRGLFVGSLTASEEPRLLIAGISQARFAGQHLLFVRNGKLMSQPFDSDQLVLRDEAVPIVEDVTLSTAGATGATAAYSVSDNGVLAYQAALRTESQPVVVDRAGTQLAALAGSGDYGDVSASPDGSHVALSLVDPDRGTRDLWIHDVSGGPGRRLTFDAGDEFAPVWSPDSRRVLFSALRSGLVDLAVADANGVGDPRRVEADGAGLGRYASDWSRDGRYFLYIGGGRAIGRSDLWLALAERPRAARALLESEFVETQGRIASAGGWFAYAANETGRLEVYVDRFPDRGAKRIVSIDGGGWPRWSRDGRELFFVSPGNQLMAATIAEAGDGLEIGAPHPLFPLRARPHVRLDAYAYDVLRGGRFVVNRLIEESTATTITLVINWPGGLTRR